MRLPTIGSSVAATLIVGLLLSCEPFAFAQAKGQAAGSQPATVRRVYSHLLDPRQHPDYDRRAVKPPTWETFKNRPQFTSVRGFGMKDERLVGFVKYTRTHELGDVIWPMYPMLFAKNLGELADEIKRRDLYLFDVWGYVPGSGGAVGDWLQFVPPADAFKTLESKLGERWLGTDIGEQDGRYIGGYANQISPASASRFEQYLNFQRHFERMSDDLGNKHSTLVSLNFGHYFLKEGTFTLIGAETAQALPNNQVYYAFIRGAGKQYGVPWFGNASIWNRWGYKTYGYAGGSGGDTHSPTNGTSLSLLKRLLYSHVLYNCVAVGFENGWFEGEKLSPVGHIQKSAQRWVKEHGQPGVMHTPVALLLDFYSGWSFPRHLYSENIYRVWGNRPYEDGDYFTDAVLDLLYPGYQDSSYFHDEAGFIAPTPYGDIADCLLSDSPLWALERYPVVIVAGELGGGREIRDKLQAYAERGGHVVITAGNLARLPVGLAGQTNVTANTTVVCGQGRVTFFASAFGVNLVGTRPYQKGAEADAPTPALRSEVDKPLPKPYTFEPDVRRGLDEILRSQQLFDVRGDGLSLITCRKRAGEFMVGIANNTWREQSFRLESLCGKIESLRELPLDQSEKSAVGQTPIGVDTAKLGTSGEGTIAGGDVRIFVVKVKEAGVEEIAHVAPSPRPKGCLLTLHRATSIKEEILARPTFFEHFDGVCVDWRYFHEREKAALQKETGWLKRQGLRVVVDLSSGMNLYPSLRLTDNLRSEYEASMAVVNDVLAKMEILGARDLLLPLHRHPETGFTKEQTEVSFTATLKALAPQAAARSVTLHLRVGFGKPPWSLDDALQWLDRIGAPNLKLAPSTALLERKSPSDKIAERLKHTLGLWLIAAPRSDVAGKLWDAHAPIHSTPNLDWLARWLKLSAGTPMVLDALYESQDGEYLDVVALESACRTGDGK